MNNAHVVNNMSRQKMVTNAKLPDALRLSGLRNLYNLLKLPVFVGRIRRSRRIRHEQRARCQQYEPPENDGKRKIA
ncbi:hypothetical protein EYW98_19775 [Escherichia coli]|uniref:hypothetical protein n=1 Tax=Escherichia sp. MOD1-EC7003 TaxID=2093900 RepID=UPI0012FFF197|nr:hypothetical protein [Escherichia sp. MOD1-EC7003]EGO8361599.1 hypothetical protein [Escherichia coli]EGO8379162.1 hypothetical protein [Escherichia coli]MCH0694573.1 hypothetical protein [Escherichia coli]